jgi:hypothetical protein
MTTMILIILLAITPLKSDVARAVDAKKTMRQLADETARCVGPDTRPRYYYFDTVYVVDTVYVYDTVFVQCPCMKGVTNGTR